MTNLMQDGATWLGNRLKWHAGRTVTYRRSQGTVSLVGCVTMNEYEVPNLDGLSTEVQSYDWTITAADLVIHGVQVTPQVGDQITETLNGTERIWEVLPVSQDKPCYEWLDTSGLLLLIHTKQVG